jgi:hypothetical protein
MPNNGIEDGWRRFLDRLRRLWGKLTGGDFDKTPSTR